MGRAVILDLSTTALIGALILLSGPLIALYLRSTRMRRAAEVQARLMDDFFDLSGDGLLLSDIRTHRIVRANARAAELFRADSPEALIGLSSEEMHAGHLDPEELSELRQMMDRGLAWRAEVEYRRLDGTSFWGDAMVRVSPERGMHYVRIADATQHRSHERALREARDLAESNAQAKGVFLAAISHELRTPLNGVLGILQFALEEPLDTAQRGRLQTAFQSATDLLTVVNEILEFCELTSAQAAPELVAFNARAQLELLTALTRPRLEGAGVRLEIQVESAVPEVIRADSEQIQKILGHLLDNAVKFTERGVVTLRLAVEGQGLRWEVADTGPGIPEVAQALIFSTFHAGRDVRSRARDGVGLGLAICRSRVEAMGGRIGFSSQPGEGSTFWFHLDAEAASSEERPAADAVNLSTLSVLVAEDNLVSQRVAQGMLERLGIEPVIVANGRLAIEASRSERFDVVLMDLHMPDVNGLDALSRWALSAA